MAGQAGLPLTADEPSNPDRLEGSSRVYWESQTCPL